MLKRLILLILFIPFGWSLAQISDDPSNSNAQELSEQDVMNQDAASQDVMSFDTALHHVDERARAEWQPNIDKYPKVDANIGGQWGELLDWPHIAISTALLPDGRVLTWGDGSPTYDKQGDSNQSVIWDPTLDLSSIQFVDHFEHNLLCSGLVMLEDGRVFANGGHYNISFPATSTFDFRTDSWTKIDNMNVGRWYPGSVVLPNQSVFTSVGVGQRIVRRSSIYSELWVEGQGWRWERGVDLSDLVLNSDLGIPEYYTYYHVAPDGRIFHSGPDPDLFYIDPTNGGSIEIVGTRDTEGFPTMGVTAVMFDAGKIILPGGMVDGIDMRLGATEKVTVIDITNPEPEVKQVSSMNIARRFTNNVMLPNGEVLVVGGSTSGRSFDNTTAVMHPESWNPTTDTWSLMNPMTVPRMYHSVATLLPDGRVFSAGGGRCENCRANQDNAQVYSPPYLFDENNQPAKRPEILSDIQPINAGQLITIEGSDNITDFSIIRLSATTHHTNTDLRFLRLPFLKEGTDTYSLQFPSNINELIPGYWMLFALNANGTPSIAKMIQVVTDLESPKPEAPNLASGAVATLSTIHPKKLGDVHGVDFEASNAIDGNIEGDLSLGSVAMSLYQREPWLEIDLGEVKRFDEIVIYNRTDCCSGQLSNFQVFVSNQSFGNRFIANIKRDKPLYTAYEVATVGKFIKLDVKDSEARFIRIQMEKFAILNLAEVEVF